MRSSCRKTRAPQVVGEIIAGLLIGPCMLGLVQQTDLISGLAEIGVVLLMFFAGLQTSLKDLMRTGWKAFLIACSGVLVPLLGGYLLYSCYYGFAPGGSSGFYSAIFTGVILTATSVSITVATLKELGYLKTETGTTIMSAAIIDDVIGIIVLTFVIGMKDPNSKPSKVIISTVLFFLIFFILGCSDLQILPVAGQALSSYKETSYFRLRTCLCHGLYCRKIFRHR